MYIGDLRAQTNLVALWQLNGNSTDTSGAGLNGTDTTITYSQANGKIGQGAGFNGTSSYIGAGAWPVLKGLSMTAWIKQAPSAVRTILSGSGNANVQFRISADSTPILELIKSQIAGIGASTKLLVNDMWTFAGASYATNGAWAFYVNGDQYGAGTTDLAITQQNINIGASVGGTAEFFKGGMGNVSIFNVVKDALWFKKQYMAYKGFWI